MTAPRAADDPRGSDVGSGPASAEPDPGPAATPESPGEPAGTESAADSDVGAAEIVEGEVVAATPTAAEPDQPDETLGEADPTVESAVDQPEMADAGAAQPEVVEVEVVTAEEVEEPAADGLEAQLVTVRSELDERTRDLQRLSAEYANYRKRVERDRGLVVEQATGQVLSALLPVLDDLDRAREHGDLVGAFGAVAEHLLATTTKFGLTAFGEEGDPFDPTRHEAVAHQTSDEVTESTCVEVMRRGYLLGDKLLRPALVAVADPE